MKELFYLLFKHCRLLKSKELHINEYLITDKISGWSSNLSGLTKSYIRDKKIDQLFNKDDK